MTGSRAEAAWFAALLAACGSAPPAAQTVPRVAPAQPARSAQPAPPAAPSARPAAQPDDDDTEESTLLGPLPRSGCFHVARAWPRRYRFVIDDVDYPRALGAGHVGVVVHATDIGDLQPVPIVIERAPQLRFEAEGEASGAFEITLFLIDGSKREGEPATLNRICAAPAP